MDKTYTLRRLNPNQRTVSDVNIGVIVHSDKPYAYKLRHIVYHSPTGMNWGYGGSGPADTALAILADFFNEVSDIQADNGDLKTGVYQKDSQALKYYQQFKFKFLCKDVDMLVITSKEIKEWVETVAG